MNTVKLYELAILMSLFMLVITMDSPNGGLKFLVFAAGAALITAWRGK